LFAALCVLRCALRRAKSMCCRSLVACAFRRHCAHHAAPGPATGQLRVGAQRALLTEPCAPQLAYIQGRFEELVGGEAGAGLAQLPAGVLAELLESEALELASELTALRVRSLGIGQGRVGHMPGLVHARG